MIKKIRIFFDDIKFEHSLFALPFAYLGLLMAEKGMPPIGLWVWITVAMVSFRTLAMALNRLMDADIDAKNPRTKDRALPSGKLSKNVMTAVASLSLVIFLYSAFALRPLCLFLAPIPFALAWIYPRMKKITWLSHFVLGSVLAIAPYGAWIATRGTFDLVPALLSFGVIAWVAAFDMIYALQDLDFDVKEGLYSFPAKFGKDLTLSFTKVLQTLSVLCWALAGLLNGQGWIYFAGVLLAALFLSRSYHLIRSYGVTRINEAFFFMNIIVSLGIFSATMIDLFF